MSSATSSARSARSTPNRCCRKSSRDRSAAARPSSNSATSPIVGTQSPPAGAAALAAGKQGRGWNFIELFYRNQGTEGSGYVTDSFLTEIAKGAGVKDIAKWNTDRKSKSIKEKVARTTAQAESLGFTGTPSFAVEGPRTNGLRTLGTPGSAEALEEAVERAG